MSRKGSNAVGIRSSLTEVLGHVSARAHLGILRPANVGNVLEYNSFKSCVWVGGEEL